MKNTLLTVFLSILFIHPLVNGKEVVNKVIAIVNSDPILQSDLTSFGNRLKKEGSIDDSLALGESISSLKSSKEKQLDYLIREKLIESEIKKQNLSVTDDRVESEINNLAKRNNMSRAELNAFIKKQGFTTSEYKETLKAKIERQSFFESEVISKLRITDEDAYNEFRQKNPNYEPSLSEFTIAQIFFSNKLGGREEAERRADKVRSQINSSDSFDKAANIYNEDKGANKNGFLGVFKSGEFNKEIEKTVSNLSDGEISRVIETNQGFHIVKVINKKNSQDPNFLRIKEQIKSYLVEQNFKRQLKNWFESKLQDSYIKIL